MLTPADLEGPSIAAVLMTDDGHYIVFGTVVLSADGPIIKADRGGQLPLSESSVFEYPAVTDDVVAMFEGADFWVPLSIGSVTDEESLAAGMLPTGINVKELDTEAR